MPSFAAITLVAPGVLFNDFAIFATPALAFAIVFICRTSSFVHSRRTIFLVRAILAPFFLVGPCIMHIRNGNVVVNLIHTHESVLAVIFGNNPACQKNF
jgi:hypothetical protein